MPPAGTLRTARIADDPDLAAVRVVVLTTFEGDAEVLGALRAGASGFLGKGVAPADLVKAVRTVAAVSVLHLSRRSSLVLAVVVSTLLFAALHLPTSGWNVLQCVLVIGTARVILLVPYLLTKNLAASATAHMVDDWALFGSAAILG
ncbi:type II CAAX prenyl endopeptidase Rce1 family protein [Isoptericola sp. NPDC056618]|uniref:CPBP family glutamic-type intramembrane protease n=1 Tax=Isoptericola sp. NPDC056618 TaxID=3345878 RepID=UPI003687F8B7